MKNLREMQVPDSDSAGAGPHRLGHVNGLVHLRYQTPFVLRRYSWLLNSFGSHVSISRPPKPTSTCLIAPRFVHPWPTRIATKQTAKIAMLFPEFRKSFLNSTNLFLYQVNRINQLNDYRIDVLNLAGQIPQNIENHAITKPTDRRSTNNWKPQRLN